MQRLVCSCSTQNIWVILGHFFALSRSGRVVQAALERWVYLWQSGSALQVIRTELKIEMGQL